MTFQNIIMLVDRSGSMHGKVTDTVGGINAQINELKSGKSEEDTIRFSLVLFDNEQIVKYQHVNIDTIGEFNESEFVPRGSTALLDAMGDAITKSMSEKNHETKGYDTCMICIATDGLENASRRYTRVAIKNLIDQVNTDNYNIEILYMGANQNAILEATSMGISHNNAINYSENPETIEAAYRSVAHVASRSRSRSRSENNNEVQGFLDAERQASVTNSVNLPPQVRRQIGTVNLVMPTQEEQHRFLDYAKNYDFNNVKNLVNSNNLYVNVVTDFNRWSALHQAAHSGNFTMVEFLLSKGANKTIVNNDNKTPYDIAINETCKNLLLVN